MHCLWQARQVPDTCDQGEKSIVKDEHVKKLIMQRRVNE